MAHYPKPFFRAPRGIWYVQIDGKQVNLGPEKDAAFKTYHGLMQQLDRMLAAIHPVSGNPLVVVIVDEFLDWCEKSTGHVPLLTLRRSFGVEKGAAAQDRCSSAG